MNCLNNFVKNESRIFCYGAGRYGRIIASWLIENNYNFLGFIVSNKSCNTTVLEYPVKSLDEYCLSKNCEDKIIICLNQKFHNDVIINLADLDIKDVFAVNEELISKIIKNTTFQNIHSSNKNIIPLIYHRIMDLKPDIWHLAISPNLFEKQIFYLKQNYQIIKADDDWSSVKKPSVVITFDDGYYDMLYTMLPIIEKYEVPVTVFVSTGNIGTINEFWWDELERIIFVEASSKYINWDGINYPLYSEYERESCCYKLHSILKKMSPDTRRDVLNEIMKMAGASSVGRESHRTMTDYELKKLAESEYITIGGHTVTHSCLGFESIEDQEWEIRESKKVLEGIIGKEVKLFSYPFGQKVDYTDDTIRIAVNAGYSRIFTAEAGLTNCNYVNGRIPRNNISLSPDILKGLRMIQTIYTDQYV